MKKNKKNLTNENDTHENGISRRDLLKLITVAGAGALCPVGGVLKLVIDNTIQKVNAAAVNSNSRNYVLIDVYGGPPRWLWDSPLIPNGSSDLFQDNNMLRTKFLPGGPLGFSTEYNTVLRNGYQMPYLWSLQVPNSMGGTRNMDELLQNMLIIRGVNMEGSGHPEANMKLTQPIPGFVSVSGLAADAGKSLIPALTLLGVDGAPYAYQSEKGTGLFSVPIDDNVNLLTSLFDAFNTKDAANSFRNNTLVKSKIDAAIDILAAFGKSNQHATDPVFQDRKKAEELFRGSLVGLGPQTFVTLTAKYETMLKKILTDAKNGAIPGITSVPIAGLKFPVTVPGNNKLLFKFGNEVSDTQLNGNVFNFDGHVIGNTDIKSIFNTANMTRMARAFAFLEFVLVNRLSNSIVIYIDQTINNMILNNSCALDRFNTEATPGVPITSANIGTNTVFSIPPDKLLNGVARNLDHDSHALGLVPNLMCFSVMYMGLSACLLELIDQLKVTKYSDDPTDLRDMFSETVIQVGSEFDRSPDHTGCGSQHSSTNSFTYLSGGIKKFQLLGNISQGSKDGGTWGIAAPVNGVSRNGGAEMIRPIHCANSICTMLRIKSVSTAEASLVNLINDVDIEIVPELELPTNKAG